MTKHERKMNELSQILFSEGKIIERRSIRHPGQTFPESYTIVEAFGQRYRIENPEGKGVKITQLPNMSNS